MFRPRRGRPGSRSKTVAVEAEDAAVCALGFGSSVGMCVSAGWMDDGHRWLLLRLVQLRSDLETEVVLLCGSFAPLFVLHRSAIGGWCADIGGTARLGMPVQPRAFRGGGCLSG